MTINAEVIRKGRLSISYNQHQSLNLPSSWILLLNFGNYVANKHDLVLVQPGSTDFGTGSTNVCAQVPPIR